MAAGIFVLDIVATLALSGALLYSYGDWLRQRLFVTLAVLVAWYFSFLIIFVLPLDVSSTAYRQCVNATTSAHVVSSTSTTKPFSSSTTVHSIITEKDINKTRFNTINAGLQNALDAAKCEKPYSLLDENVLPNLWRIVYWSSQLLTWLVLPLMQSYTQAGEFTAWGKIKSSLWDNVIYYASYLFIAVILVIYIAMQPDLHLNWERTKAIAAAASNTWGLFVLVLMLGYGLVEVPRNCWNRSQKGYQLTRAYFRVAKLMSEKSEAEETLDDVLLSVNHVSTMIGQSDLRRPLLETILGKIPLEMMERIQRRRGVEPDFGSEAPNEKTLTRLHRQVIRALQNGHRTEAQWADWTNHVFELEDVNKNMVSNEHRFIHSLSRPPSRWLSKTIFNPTFEWYWKCLLSPLLLRFAAGMATVMSILIIWSEVTFFSMNPTLSVFAAFVNLANDNKNYLAIEAVCLATVFYLCLCTYYTVFKMRVLDYYYLAGNHQSDEYTLLFSGALLCRLTPPLCLNFLSLIHMDSHVLKSQVMETAYTRIMGHMDVVSIVSDYFNIYFPIALLVLTLATYFSLGTRLLSMLGFQQFLAQDSDVTMELVEEGKEHIKREKRRRQRLAESATRRREFASRFGDVEDSRDVRLRATDIVKSNSRQGTSSPERSLLSHQATPMHQQQHSSPLANNDSGDIDLSSPSTVATNIVEPNNREPPRNIFDDL